MRSSFLHLTAGLLVATLLAGCGGGGEPSTGSSGGTSVTATLSEFHVALDRSSAPAGTITLKAQNKGTVPHELVVMKTDLAPEKLPVKDGKADENAGTVAGEIAEFDPGKSEAKTFTLTAGKYVLICNVPAHYQAGMAIAFTVQ